MTTKIRGWISKEQLAAFEYEQAKSYSSFLTVATEPIYHDDICIEMTIVDPTVLERDEIKVVQVGGLRMTIKPIDEEGK
jgi:hypothetical protein